VASKIGINGFGRIGRMFFRAALGSPELEVVAVNDITNAATLAHLLKHDSIHGTLKHEIKTEGTSIVVDGRPIQVLAERDPAKLPWTRLGVQAVSNRPACSPRVTRPRFTSRPAQRRS